MAKKSERKCWVCGEKGENWTYSHLCTLCHGLYYIAMDTYSETQTGCAPKSANYNKWRALRTRHGIALRALIRRAKGGKQ